jgi:hypothetical protein
MSGQIAYHLMAQAQVAQAPWPITTLVSRLPVLVLGMGTALAHMLRADASTGNGPDRQAEGPATPRSPALSPQDQAHPRPDQGPDGKATAVPAPPAETRTPRHRGRDMAAPAAAPDPPTEEPGLERARLIASRLAAAGKPVSRRTLRSSGVKGSNETLNALARMVNAELARAEAQPAKS